MELVDLIDAVPVVQAGAAGTLVRVDFTVNTLVTCESEIQSASQSLQQKTHMRSIAGLL